MPDDFETRLRSVPWDMLYHSYGPAGDVPDMLLALRSPRSKVRRDARNNLEWSLNHQGVQRHASTARAVPFLLEMLPDTSLRERHLLLAVLAEFAVGSTDGRVKTTLLDALLNRADRTQIA